MVPAASVFGRWWYGFSRKDKVPPGLPAICLATKLMNARIEGGCLAESLVIAHYAAVSCVYFGCQVKDNWHVTQ